MQALAARRAVAPPAVPTNGAGFPFEFSQFDAAGRPEYVHGAMRVQRRVGQRSTRFAPQPGRSHRMRSPRIQLRRVGGKP